MDSGTHYAEYATTQKPEGKYSTKRILFIIGYVVVLIGMITLASLVFQGGTAFLFGFIFLVLEIALVFFTWRFTKPDYKYVIEVGDIKFYTSYGKKFKLVTEKKIKDIDVIAPYTDEYNAPTKASDVSALYDFRGTVKTPDAYFVLFKDKNEKKTVVLFEATEKAVALLYYYNKETVKAEGFRH